MAATFKIWSDAGLTQEFDPATDFLELNDSTADFHLWIGSNDSSRKLEANSDPGVDQLTLTPTDADPGNNHETDTIKIADTQANLASATAGAAYNLGTVINGGVGNAVDFWVRLTDQLSGSVLYDANLSIDLNDAIESQV